MVKIPKDVQTQIARRSAEIIKIQFEKEINTRFLQVKNQMIREFLNHPVTKEIKGGPTADNISGTLGGNGNLFSYIGFEEGSDPIDPILNEFQKINLRFAGISGETANWTILFPTKDDIWDVSPVPWHQVALGPKVWKLDYLELASICTMKLQSLKTHVLEQLYKQLKN